MSRCNGPRGGCDGPRRRATGSLGFSSYTVHIQSPEHARSFIARHQISIKSQFAGSAVQDVLRALIYNREGKKINSLETPRYDIISENSKHICIYIYTYICRDRLNYTRSTHVRVYVRMLLCVAPRVGGGVAKSFRKKIFFLTNRRPQFW